MALHSPWGLKMLKFLRLSAVCCFCLILPGTKLASAYSLFYNFTFSGFVETATAKTQLGTLPDTLHGQPFGASFSIDPLNATGFASLTTNLPFTFPAGDPNLPIVTASGLSFSGPASLLSPGHNNFSGSVGSLTFLYIDGSPSSNILTANVTILAVHRADDSGSLSLTLQPTAASFSVSPVPLPPALPMFASALLILGIFGFVRRKKDVTAACLT
jgi:hypothetical protein